jgi:flagellar protein FlgJ
MSTIVATPGATSAESLRATARSDPKAAIRETAKQFEALFMQQLLKSMRDATPASGMLDNEGTKLGTEMLDQQLATKMSGLPGGLADAIARQLERQTVGEGGIPAAKATAAPRATGPAVPLSARQADFVSTHADAARSAEQSSGIPAAFMVAQAAHETGWGRKEIRTADGGNSFNVFGIKAGTGWTGATADITTTEWVGGEPQKMTQKFRAYASYDEAFRDYARLLSQSPRYAQVVADVQGQAATPATAQQFAQGLQKAGYATDPAYADKLGRVINQTLRWQKAVA